MPIDNNPGLPFEPNVSHVNTEELIKKWIKQQHGTAGWEMKLQNFIKELIDQALHQRDLQLIEKLKELRSKAREEYSETRLQPLEGKIDAYCEILNSLSSPKESR